MAAAKLHKSQVRNLRGNSEWTNTTTLCRRMSNKGDELNIADTDDHVTCKFCLRIMKRQAKD